MKRRIRIPEGLDLQGRYQPGEVIEFEDDEPADEPFRQEDGALLAACWIAGLIVVVAVVELIRGLL